MAIGTAIYIISGSGWDQDNIPDSPELASSVGSVELKQGVVMRQSMRDHIDLEVNDARAREIDYLLSDKDGKRHFYFVLDYEMLATNVARFYLEIDGLTTLGALRSGSNIVDGWLKRKLKPLGETRNLDAAVKLTIAEPWSPSEELVEEFDNNIVGANASGFSTLVQSVTDLMKDTKKAKDYISSEDNYVTVPDMSGVTKSTVFQIQSSDSALNSAFSTAGMGIYLGTNTTVSQGIMATWALGIPSVKKSYVMPLSYAVPETDEKFGFVERLVATERTVGTSIPIMPGGYVPENYKAALLHQRIRLLSTCSGQSSEYSLSQLGGNLTFTYWANPVPEGMPFCRPTYINGNGNRLYGAVAGSQWQTAPFAEQTKFGAINEIKDAKRNFWGDYLGAAGGILTSAAGGAVAGAAGGPVGAAAGGVVGALGGVASGVTRIRDIPQQIDRNQNLRAPDIMFAASGDMQNFIGNDFSVVRSRLSTTDIIRFDDFLHKYGEAVDEGYEPSDIYTRSNYNYIQMERVSITADSSNHIKRAAKAQLMRGVRVWHVKPNARALEVGGN